jgi:hypothetical protein
MPDTPEILAQRLQTEGQKVLAFFGDLLPDQWEASVYAEDQAAELSGKEHAEPPAGMEEEAGWRVRQVLAHFVSSEASFLRLIGDILTGGSGAPEDFDIDRFNRRKVADLASQTPAELLAQFAEHRQSTVELVSCLVQEDLKKTGRHPYLGVVPLTDTIKMIYRHNQIHLRDLRRVLRS